MSISTIVFKNRRIYAWKSSQTSALIWVHMFTTRTYATNDIYPFTSNYLLAESLVIA